MNERAPCQLPTQACEGCGEFFLDADLQEVWEGSAMLHCAGCAFDAQKRYDAANETEFYGA
jgi:hypothetical protein